MEAKKKNPNELCDEALDAVSGGAGTCPVIIAIPEVLVNTDTDKSSDTKNDSTANNV